MYKNIIRAAFLFATGIFMTACSSGDDNIADNTTPVTPDTKEVTLTGIISASGDLTRAVGADGKEVYWQVNDEICVQYTSKDGVTNVKGKITEVVDAHNAKFTATLTNLAPNSTSNSIGLAYPYSNVTAGGGTVTNFSFDNSLLYSQVGTIDGINNAKLDVAWTTTAVGITIDKANATLDNDAILTNQVCIAKFTLYEGASGTNPFKTMSLTVTNNGTSEDYAVTTTTKTNEFFVVLPAISGSITVKAIGQQKYTETPTPTEITSSRTDYTYGQYIVVDPSTRKAYTAAVSNTANDTEYSKTYANSKLKAGKFYAQPINIGQDYIPVAVIAHVGAIKSQVEGYTSVNAYCKNFLALALEDAYAGVKNLHSAYGNVSTWASAHAIKIEGDATTYNSVLSAAYDQVQECAQIGGDGDNKHKINTSTAVTSASRTTAFTSGWRVPSVTDLRYILHNLNVISTVTPTSPIGIMDHSGQYYSNSTSTSYSNGTSLYPTINNNLCHNNNLDGEFYWLSSEVINTSETVMSNKAWRYDFSVDYFIWTESNDNSLARLVFAY